MTAHHLNARGLVCPLPVLKARKVLLRLAPGDVLTVSVTDDNAPKDFGLFCAEAGHRLQSVVPDAETGGHLVTILRG
jgi:tRNA 2-thiouridine synthesizing protein A